MAGEHPNDQFGSLDWYAPYILDGGNGGALAVDSFGNVAGSYFARDLGQRASLYANGARIDLGTLGGRLSCARGINDSQQVVGSAETGLGREYAAFLYSGGEMRVLAGFGGTRSDAYAINNQAQIVGVAEMTFGLPHAFLYQNGTVQDLGTLGGNTSIARDVNDRGQIVGDADIGDSQPHAFLFENGSMRNLGTLPGDVRSSANGVNLHGDVVGKSYDLAKGDLWEIGSDWRAFLVTGGRMHDLNDLTVDLGGWRLCEAYGINDRGQIVGWALAPDGHDHGFLLTVVPEPGVVPVLLVGVFLIRTRRPRAPKAS